MPHRYFLSHLVAVVVLVGSITGCDPSSVESAKTEPTSAVHSADQGFDHGQTGPNGGHLIELDGGSYHAEWLHEDESGRVTVVLLDDKPEQEVAIAADHVTIAIAVGDRRDCYALPAIGSAGHTGASGASRFELVSPNLLVGLQMGEGVDATLTVEIGEKTYVGQIEHHAHDQHGHHHH